MLINVSTAAMHAVVMPGGSSYSASKAAVVRLMDFVAVENPSVRVVNLHPGVVATEMNAKSGMKMPTDDGMMSLPPSPSRAIRVLVLPVPSDYF